MSTFANFPSTTPRLGLPFLFVGQSQKEFFVNQALAVIDALLQQSINGTLAAPPPDPQEGDCYRIAAPASGTWEEHEDKLALHLGGDWQFIVPIVGGTFYDRTLQQHLHFDGEWQSSTVPETAVGGAIIDAEARALLAQVIDALAKLGLVD